MTEHSSFTPEISVSVRIKKLREMLLALALEAAVLTECLILPHMRPILFQFPHFAPFFQEVHWKFNLHSNSWNLDRMSKEFPFISIESVHTHTTRISCFIRIVPGIKPVIRPQMCPRWKCILNSSKICLIIEMSFLQIKPWNQWWFFNASSGHVADTFSKRTNINFSSLKL